MTYIVRADSAFTPGRVAHAGQGDVVVVRRDALRRHDWAAMVTAISIAFSRGARVEMEGEDE